MHVELLICSKFCISQILTSVDIFKVLARMKMILAETVGHGLTELMTINNDKHIQVILNIFKYLLFNWRQRKTKLLADFGPHMDLGNGICDLWGFFKIIHWSYLIKYFDRYICNGLWRLKISTYSNSLIKLKLKYEILTMAVTKKCLLNKDYNCSK